MPKSPAEGFDDSRQTTDPYRRESPSTTDASAGRTRTVARSGIQSSKAKGWSNPEKGS